MFKEQAIELANKFGLALVRTEYYISVFSPYGKCFKNITHEHYINFIKTNKTQEYCYKIVAVLYVASGVNVSQNKCLTILKMTKLLLVLKLLHKIGNVCTLTNSAKK